MEMAKNKLKKNQFLIIVVTVVVTLVLLLALLRCCHVILCVGDSYKLCFSTTYRVSGYLSDGMHDINDDNISEIRYMKNLKHFSAMYTNLTNIDFITNFKKLESLSYCLDSNQPQNIVKSIPKLENCHDLMYIYLYGVGVEDLNFLSDCTNLKYLTVVTHDSEITDISGLKNKQILKIVQLRNVNCSDYSVLLELPSLEYLDLYNSEIPIEIKNELLNKNVKINESGAIKP